MSVDLVIGTTTIGSHLASPTFSDNLLLGKYLVPEKLTGLCTGHFYCCDEFSIGTIIPALYTDNDNHPHLRKSKKEGYVSSGLSMNAPVGWRSATFEIDGSIGKGSYVWFGVRARTFRTRHDNTDDITVSIHAPHSAQNPMEILPGSILLTFNRAYSMYFTYEPGPPGDDHHRIIVQGVSLTDRGRIKADYKREKKEITKITGISIQSFIKIIACHIFSRASVKAKTNRQAEYHRIERSTVLAKGIGFMSRVLKARSEIVLKSSISQDLCVGRIYKGQSDLRITLRTFINLEGIIKAVIRYRNPNGKQGEFAAGLSNGEKGLISYECQAGDIDVSGWWAFWAFIIFEDGRTAIGQTAKVYVWKQGSG